MVCHSIIPEVFWAASLVKEDSYLLTKDLVLYWTDCKNWLLSYQIHFWPVWQQFWVFGRILWDTLLTKDIAALEWMITSLLFHPSRAVKGRISVSWASTGGEICDKAHLDFELVWRLPRELVPKSLMPKEKTMPVLCSLCHCGADLCSELLTNTSSA